MKKNRVLIGSRTKKDEYVENLSWSFPGGALKSLDFSEEVEKFVKKETGFKVKTNQLVATRTHPDSGFKNIQIVALYFHCKLIGGQENLNNDFTKVKWVKPLDVFKYFTTSTCDDVTKFLTMLEKSL